MLGRLEVVERLGVLGRLDELERVEEELELDRVDELERVEEREVGRAETDKLESSTLPAPNKAPRSKVRGLRLTMIFEGAKFVPRQA